MRIIKIDPSDYKESELSPAVETLVKGGLVVFPTETVYGIAVNADAPNSVGRLISLKRSPPDRPFTYHITDMDEVYRYVTAVPHLAHRFIRNLWPGPLTIVLEDPNKKWVGVRLPDHPVARDLIRMARVPIIAPSANLTGQPPPSDCSQINPLLLEEVDMLIDSGPTRFGQSSTVVKITPENQWAIVREGVIKKEQLVRLAIKTILFVCTGNTCRSPMAVALLSKLLSDKLGVPVEKLEEKGYRIISGGTAAINGASASNFAVAVVKESGGDIFRHCSQPVTLTMIEEADQVYVMTSDHLATLKEWLPSAATKISLLDPQGEDIKDPLGGDIEIYRECARKIKSALEIIVKDITEGDVK